MSALRIDKNQKTIKKRERKRNNSYRNKRTDRTQIKEKNIQMRGEK